MLTRGKPPSMVYMAAPGSAGSPPKEAPAGHGEPASSVCHLALCKPSSRVCLGLKFPYDTLQAWQQLSTQANRCIRRARSHPSIQWNNCYWFPGFFPPHWLFNWIDGCWVELIAPASPFSVLETKWQCFPENEWISSLKRMFKQMIFFLWLWLSSVAPSAEGIRKHLRGPSLHVNMLISWLPFHFLTIPRDWLDARMNPPISLSPHRLLPVLSHWNPCVLYIPPHPYPWIIHIKADFQH